MRTWQLCLLGAACCAVGVLEAKVMNECTPRQKPVMFHPIQYTKDWSFGDPHQIGKPPQAWQQPEGVACLIVLDAERMRAIGNPVDIPQGFYTQLFVGNFPKFGDKLTMECETVEQ